MLTRFVFPNLVDVSVKGVKVKVKFTLEQATKAQRGGGKSYSSTISLTSALDGVGGQSHAPAALPPGKARYPIYRRLCGPQGRCEKSRPYRDSIPGPPSPWRVAIPTELSRPIKMF